MHGVWWIADESPHGLGGPEIWIDEVALDLYGRGDASPAVIIRQSRIGTNGSRWTGALIQFNAHPGLDKPVAYMLVSRRHSQDNGGRPFYVARWPG
jgi:hypothetical protein